MKPKTRIKQLLDANRELVRAVSLMRSELKEAKRFNKNLQRRNQQLHNLVDALENHGKEPENSPAPLPNKIRRRRSDKTLDVQET